MNNFSFSSRILPRLLLSTLAFQKIHCVWKSTWFIWKNPKKWLLLLPASVIVVTEQQQQKRLQNQKSNQVEIFFFFFWTFSFYSRVLSVDVFVSFFLERFSLAFAILFLIPKVLIYRFLLLFFFCRLVLFQIFYLFVLFVIVCYQKQNKNKNSFVLSIERKQKETNWQATNVWFYSVHSHFWMIQHF